MWLNLPNPGEGWNARDRSLAEALTVYEDSLNPMGIPSWIARDPERSWVPDEIVDGSLAVLEEARDEMSKGQGKNYGVRLVVVESDRPRTHAQRPVSPDLSARRNRDEALGG